VINSLNYRHWDTWEDGKFDHIFVAPMVNGKPARRQSRDLLFNEAYDAPTKPFGGDEDYVWSPDGKHLVYVTKKKQEPNTHSVPILICLNTMQNQAPLKILLKKTRDTM
jgi:Tol biopolymer transport system component